MKTSPLKSFHKIAKYSTDLETLKAAWQIYITIKQTVVIQMVDDFLLEKYLVWWTIFFCSYPFYWRENWLLQILAEFQFFHLETDNLYSQTEAQIPTINDGKRIINYKTIGRTQKEETINSLDQNQPIKPTDKTISGHLQTATMA